MEKVKNIYFDKFEQKAGYTGLYLELDSGTRIAHLTDSPMCPWEISEDPRELNAKKDYNLAIDDIKKIISDIKLTDRDYKTEPAFDIVDYKKGFERFKKKLLEIL